MSKPLGTGRFATRHVSFTNWLSSRPESSLGRPIPGSKFDKCQTCDKRLEADRKCDSATRVGSNTLVSSVLWQFLICSPRQLLSFLVVASHGFWFATNIYAAVSSVWNGSPKPRSNSRASSSESVDEHKAMFIPCTRTYLSGFSSGNTNCSLKPRL